MKNLITFCFLISSVIIVKAQSPWENYYAREYQESRSIYKAKQFLIQDVLGEAQEPIFFEFQSIAASTSAEVTSAIYKCQEKQKLGLLLGFFGRYVSKQGVSYTGYAFKHFTKEEGLKFLKRIETVVDGVSRKMSFATNNAHNIYFKYDDMTIMIYKDQYIKVRILWDNFDSEWDISSFDDTLEDLEDL